MANEYVIKMLAGECWYGGAAHRGLDMPVGANADFSVDLITCAGLSDQCSPLFLSNKGRFLHSDKPFRIHFDHGTIRIDALGEVELADGFGTLKGAALAAAKRFFSLTGETPHPLFLERPQYNTWIELMYDQNQKQILEYAHGLVDAGLEPGILMIDEGWAADYGEYDFDRRKFPDAKAMVDELHALGFTVMVWIVPYISPDNACFRSLRKTDLLVKEASGEFAVRKWWNGYSVILDLTNPETVAWLNEKLHWVMDTYGVDGFKFDGGDPGMYRPTDKVFAAETAVDNTRAFNKFGSAYTFNEFRRVWDGGGLPLVCRLQDKKPNWTEFNGLLSLVPNMIQQGLLGYYYGCPDMIGGGEYSQFLKGYHVDEELYIRWLEASVLCPMMQFSISPKRILSPESLEIVRKVTKLHAEYAPTIMALAKNASVTGEPILRPLAYEYPDEGFDIEMEMFLLGSDVLVAPVLEKGAVTKTLRLPAGKWTYLDGKVYEGGTTVTVAAPLDVLPLFMKG